MLVENKEIRATELRSHLRGIQEVRILIPGRGSWGEQMILLSQAQDNRGRVRRGIPRILTARSSDRYANRFGL